MLQSDAAVRTANEPGYLSLERSGELAERARALYAHFLDCHLCPRDCRIDRRLGDRGVCRSSSRARVYAAHPHFGEERPLVGHGGSGTIFFSGCGLRCAYCQNWEIAHRRDGTSMSDAALGRLMMRLQDQGCHNINLVTPTHAVPNIVQALQTAIPLGLHVPLVYNSGGYESVTVLKLLDGIIDIYLPDFKYASAATARRYSAGVKDYPVVARAAIEEMHRQVGNLILDENGIAARGLMLRHLVLPENLAGTDRFVRFVAHRLGPSTYVNLMPQYRPAYKAGRFPELARTLTAAEYEQALAWAREAGLTRLAAAD